MKNAHPFSFIYSLLIMITLLTSCNGQGKVKPPGDVKQSSELPTLPERQDDSQIADYIRNIYQDKNGGFWLGTNGYGVAYYNGSSLSYFSNKEGFDGQQVTGIAEDVNKNIWFSTNQGVVKYDWSDAEKGEVKFTNYSVQTFIGSNQFWSVFCDSKGRVWAGSATGVYRFDGIIWTPFELPYPKEKNGEFITKRTSWSISEDKLGNMWFSTNGYGAFKYDGQIFTQYSEKDGLADNSIDHILEDKNGNIWFGTRYGGISRYDGQTFTNYTEKDSIGNNEVCVVFEDKAGNIWFSSEGYGVYSFDGMSFTNYNEKQGLGVKAVQTIFEDREGRLWVGGGGGLYRLDRDSFVNVTKNGPWE